MSMKDEDAITGVFAALTHQPLLFFSSQGKVYMLKVWRLPLGSPTSKGKAFVNLLPLGKGETITKILTLPESEAEWEGMDIVFATRSGDIRRNKLSDFVNVNRAGKIAMKLEDDDAIVGVAITSEDQDVLLTTSLGRCIRFSVNEVRVFVGRSSTGVRAIKLAKDDHVISLAVLNSVEATASERSSYIKKSRSQDDNLEPSDEMVVDEDADDADIDLPELSQERYEELAAQEQFILTMTEQGFGKRSSAYDYRRSGRGGQGLMAHDLSKKSARLVAAFAVDPRDEILVVTDGGQLIRTKVGQIRIAGRNTQGVTIIKTHENERVVSVERLCETPDDESIDQDQTGLDPSPDLAP
jgi:DNA gyrase subunit A